METKLERVKALIVGAYDPSCWLCREQAGKDRAKLGDDDLCFSHAIAIAGLYLAAPGPAPGELRAAILAITAKGVTDPEALEVYEQEATELLALVEGAGGLECCCARVTAPDCPMHGLGGRLSPPPAETGLRDLARKAAEGGKAAADELMTEFISKKRAANWGVINDGLIACQELLNALEAPRPEKGAPDDK